MTPDLPPGAVRLSREQLHALAWSEPMTKLAARFGISDVALAKTCRNLHIPVPPRGYWQQLASGKNPARIRLLKAPEGTQEFAVLTAVDPAKVTPRPRKPKTAKTAPPPEPTAEPDGDGSGSPTTASVPTDVALPLPLPDKVARLHPLMSATKDALLRSLKGPGATGFASAYGSEALTVRGLGPASIDRACRILHVVIKELERRGRKVFVEKGESFVQVGAEKVKFRMEEKKETTQHKPTAEEIARQEKYSWQKPPKTDSWPTGNLVIRVEEYVSAPRKGEAASGPV